jgi:hypothetical protein
LIELSGINQKENRKPNRSSSPDKYRGCNLEARSEDLKSFKLSPSTHPISQIQMQLVNSKLCGYVVPLFLKPKRTIPHIGFPIHFSLSQSNTEQKVQRLETQDSVKKHSLNGILNPLLLN